MRALKRIGITLVICIVVCFIAIGFQVWLDLSTREDDVLTYTRLAMKNALVNIQTTEQEGYNYLSSGKSKTYQYDSKKYQEYLADLLAQTGASSDTNMKTIREFLKANIDNASGDALFRPIQFGMTYVDKELFEESFETAIQDLVEANYNMANKYEVGGVSFTTKAPSALKIDSCDFKISDPQLGEIPTSGGAVTDIYKSIYGIDTFEQAAATNLGFTSSAINFYIYYDIEVTVNWSSASTNLLMTKSFLSSLTGRNKVRSNLEYTPSENGSPEYLYIPGKSITYTYRYVLTN